MCDEWVIWKKSIIIHKELRPLLGKTVLPSFLTLVTIIITREKNNISPDTSITYAFKITDIYKKNIYLIKKPLKNMDF